ncbi:MAG: hypothetical protein QGF59_02270, partial [Pirellulaceae bacterium]|nr:hypothetical protein [Pirellulaceae bacterium]
WSSQTTSKGYPTFYTMWGYPPSLKVVLYPTPSEAGTLKVFYYQHSTDLATTYCEMVALRKDRDPRWQEARALYMDTLTEMQDRTRRWTDQGDFIQVGQTYVPGWLWGSEW